jgi:hypothetical protein
MPNRFLICGPAATAVLLASLICPPMLRAQNASKLPAPGSPEDISGVWLQSSGGDQFDLPRDVPIQLAARAKFLSEKNGHGPNIALGYDSNTDPFIKYCDPLGVPRVLLANHPFKIVSLPAEIIVLYERSRDSREIYADGRQHPKDLDPSWWGNSIGTWENGTLVVDSVGFNDKTWLDYQGLPHSEALHIIERYRRADHDTLQLTLTIDDPKAYTKPWSVNKTYTLKPWDIGEEICTISSEGNFNKGIVQPASVPPPK